METKRQSRVARLIQKELSNFFLIHQHAIGAMVTVTVVRVSPDLSYAKAYISIFSTVLKEVILEKIQHQLPEIRRELALNIRFQLRKLPEIVFFIDDSLDYVERIEELLKK